MIFKYKVKSGGSRNLEQSIVITSSHRSRRSEMGEQNLMYAQSFKCKYENNSL